MITSKNILEIIKQEYQIKIIKKDTKFMNNKNKF